MNLKKAAAPALFSAGLFLTASCAVAAESTAADFPPELFPPLAGKSEAEVRLAGIAALCPGRLLRQEPKPAARSVPELRKPRTAELPRGGAYVRLYAPDADSVRERVGNAGGLVVDCRYLQTAATDTGAVAELAAALGGAPKWRTHGEFPAPVVAKSEPATRKRPVIVLVNRRTSGPLEAALASLQSAGMVKLVGAGTAGETGVYRPLPGQAGWWVLSGEILPESGVSLVGVGVMPKFPVAVTPEEEFTAWQVVERGSPLGAVLPRETTGKTETGKTVGGPDAGANGKAAEKVAEVTDPVLARGQEVLAALRVLGGE